MRVSPWNGLTSPQLAALDAAVSEPQRQSMSLKDAYRDVHAEFSRRTVTLLVSNDLRGALDAAAIAFWSLELAEGRSHRSGHVIGRHERVGRERPAAAKSGIPARLTHVQTLQ